MKRGVGVYYGVKGDARGVQVGSTGTLGVSGGPGGRHTVHQNWGDEGQFRF